MATACVAVRCTE